MVSSMVCLSALKFFSFSEMVSLVMVVLALFVEDGSGGFLGDLCRFLVDVALNLISLFLFFMC